MIVNNILDRSVKEALANNQLIVTKTDTIYGILARADSVESMKKLYEAKTTQPRTIVDNLSHGCNAVDRKSVV